MKVHPLRYFLHAHGAGFAFIEDICLLTEALTVILYRLNSILVSLWLII